MSIRRFCCLFSGALALSGCVVPAPSVDQRSPEVSGRVLDAVTKQPVKGAVVMLHDHPSYQARTDGGGIYRIRARHNVHLLLILGICGEQIPEGNYYRADELDISDPLYETARIEAARYIEAPPINDSAVVLRDVALTPISQP